MNINISKNVLEQINNFIETKFGLYFSEERLNNLKRAVINASSQKDIDSDEYISRLLSSQLSEEDLINLANCLTIGETYFLRDRKLFDIMRQKILPDIIDIRKHTSKKIKIWSAGCSSGEEAYSMATLIKELIPDYEEWDIRIIGTDINQNSLNKARKAVYSEWSFRGVDLNFKNKYFDRVDGTYYKLKEDVAKFVDFYTLNLADDTYKIDNKIINNVDILLCRNVLMYFSKEQVYKIISRFHAAIKNGGWLVGSPTENLYFNNSSFKPVNFNGAFLYSRDIKYNNVLKDLDNDIKFENSLIKNEITGAYSKLDIHIDSSIKKDSITTENNISKIDQSKDLTIIEELVEEDELNKDGFETLARSLANEGKLEEAQMWCEKAISNNKINPVYYHLLANIQQEQGNISEAILSLKKAIYLNSDFIIAYFDLGNLNLKQGNIKEALKNFRNVYALINDLNEEDIIPYSDETTVGMLKQTIDNMNCKGDIYG